MLWLLLLSQLPVVAIFSYVYLQDKHEPEPISLLFKTFLGGALIAPVAAIGTVLFKSFFAIPEDPQGLVLALFVFFGVALIEELGKYFVLRFYAYRQPDFNEPFDGIMYSVAVALGFAALENFLYVAHYGISVAIMRMFTAVPLHAMTGIVFGYFAGLAKFSNEPLLERTYLRRGLFLAVIFHGLYDFLAFQHSGILAIFCVLVLAIELVYARKAIVMHQTSPCVTTTPMEKPEVIKKVVKTTWSTYPLITLAAVWSVAFLIYGVASAQLLGAGILIALLAVTAWQTSIALRVPKRWAWLLAFIGFVLSLPTILFPISLAGLYGLFLSDARRAVWLD